jgi:hypothetical protein
MKRDLDDWWEYDKNDNSAASFETIYAIMNHIAQVKAATGDIFPELQKQNKSFLWQQPAVLTSRITYDGIFGTIDHKNPDGTINSTVTPVPEYTPMYTQQREESLRKTTRLTLVRSTSDRPYLIEEIKDATEQLVQATFGKNHENYVEILRRGVNNLSAEINIYTPAISTRMKDTTYMLNANKRTPSAQIDIGYELPAAAHKGAYIIQLVKKA